MEVWQCIAELMQAKMEIGMALLRLVTIIIGVTVLGACGPSSYDECILDNVKEAKTGNGAAMIHRACRSQFPMENHFDKFDDSGEVIK